MSHAAVPVVIWIRSPSALYGASICPRQPGGQQGGLFVGGIDALLGSNADIRRGWPYMALRIPLTIRAIE